MFVTPRNIKIILIIIYVISLFGCSTNFFYFSTLFFFVLLFSPILFFKNFQLENVVKYTAYVYLYFLLSTLIYNPSALLSFPFYRWDGNFFISFFPIILFSCFSINFNVKKSIYLFILFSSFLNFLLMSKYLLSHSENNPNDFIYFSLFRTHNAAGGFLSILLAFTLSFWIKNKNILNTLLLTSNFTALVLTDSRGSLFGFFMACIVHLVLKERHNKKTLFIFSSILVIILSFTYPIWSTITHEGENISTFDMSNVDEELELGVGRQHTIFHRAFAIWPQAVFLWFMSPLFGTGFGSYNDIPYLLKGIKYIFQMNFSESYLYNNAHAHLSYLHILAETGLVGLSLVILMMFQMHKFILSLEDTTLRRGLALAFWTLIWSSMTEHRLFTPAQALPFTLALGMILSCKYARMPSRYFYTSKLQSKIS